ncbi:MAG TPA: fibronectin type III domain-containing protein [Bacteroidota bacterium]|nr:fibronectin type III domain-containing protein [Bacteroidota bacterium]
MMKARDHKLFFVRMICLALLAFSACSEGSTEPELVINLDPPSELQASRVPGKVAVRLTWKDNSNSEVGFAIERRQNNGTFQDRIFTIKDVTSAIDSMGLTIGATYSYRIRATRYSEASPPSNVATVTLTP